MQLLKIQLNFKNHFNIEQSGLVESVLEYGRIAGTYDIYALSNSNRSVIMRNGQALKEK